MGSRYTGRHRAAAHASEAGAFSPVTRASRRRHPPGRALRRPVLTAGAVLALVGASAAGYAKAGDVTSGSAATFTLPATAVAQANEARDEQLDRASYRQQATRVLSLRQSAATDATRAEQVAEAAKLQAEREAAQAQASRDAQRESVIANAQQDPRFVARMMLPDFGWDDSQWSCLERLWVGESGWNYQATNRSSGAYGIPQSLPASKMGTVADDYLTNPVTQITWGMQYIEASYGNPCGALSCWNAKSPHWY